MNAKRIKLLAFIFNCRAFGVLTIFAITVITITIGCTKSIKTNQSGKVDSTDLELVAKHSAQTDDCKIDFEFINDSLYNHHLAIYRILNGLEDDSIVNGKLFTMFQFSLFPDEDSNHYRLTNHVIIDLLSSADTYNKFHLDNELFDNYNYLVDHLKNPICFNYSFEHYRELINRKVIAQSDSSKKLKSDILDFVQQEHNLH